MRDESSGRLRAAGQLTVAAGSDSSGELISSYYHAEMSCRVLIPIHLCSISISLRVDVTAPLPWLLGPAQSWGCYCHPSPHLSQGDASPSSPCIKPFCPALFHVTTGTHHVLCPQEECGHSWCQLWELWEHLVQLYVPGGRLSCQKQADPGGFLICSGDANCYQGLTVLRVVVYLAIHP